MIVEAESPNQSLARRAIAFLRRKKQEEPPASEIPDPASVRIPRSVMAEIRNYAFVEWLLRLLTGGLFINVALMIALLLASHSASNKNTTFVQAPPTLRALSDDFYKTDGIRFDEVATSVIATLPLLHHIDPDGAPLFALLQGEVAPDIYRDAEAGFKKAMPVVKRDQVIQGLYITAIEDMEAEPKLRRVSCYVHGYFSVAFQQTGKHKKVEYRAEVLLEKNTSGALNALPYTIIKRTEKKGDDAVRWDAERKAARPGRKS